MNANTERILFMSGRTVEEPMSEGGTKAKPDPSLTRIISQRLW